MKMGRKLIELTEKKKDGLATNLLFIDVGLITRKGTYTHIKIDTTMSKVLGERNCNTRVSGVRGNVEDHLYGTVKDINMRRSYEQHQEVINMLKQAYLNDEVLPTE